MNVEKILQLIPESELEFLSAETKVDHQVKKLSGALVFKLILFSMLNSQRVSLRVMEQFFCSASFRNFSGTEQETKYNSIRDRIATINSEYFHRIFMLLFERFNKELNEQQAILKVDTTCIAASAKLVDWSLKVSSQVKGDNQRHLKVGMGVKGSLPCRVEIFTNHNAASEDHTIPQVIFNCAESGSSIVTFDRGVQSRKTFDKLSNNNIVFVSRLRKTSVFKIVKQNALDEQSENDTLTINEDCICHLKNQFQKWTENTFRVIKATIRKTNEPIWFITNETTLSAKEITCIYKKRWEIEVFFKFLKQHLNLSHLVARNENGIKVMIYMTVILAILLSVYKQKNKIQTYKIAKLRFEIQLDNMMMKEVVILCGGNPDNAPHLWNST